MAGKTFLFPEKPDIDVVDPANVVQIQKLKKRGHHIFSVDFFYLNMG